MTYQAYIVRDPTVCGGVPIVRGTRVPVRTILSSLEAGDSFEVIMRDFPSVSTEALRAIIAKTAGRPTPRQEVERWTPCTAH